MYALTGVRVSSFVFSLVQQENADMCWYHWCYAKTWRYMTVPWLTFSPTRHISMSAAWSCSIMLTWLWDDKCLDEHGETAESIGQARKLFLRRCQTIQTRKGWLGPAHFSETIRMVFEKKKETSPCHIPNSYLADNILRPRLSSSKTYFLAV